MINMKRVGREHRLMLDIDSDMSHLFNNDAPNEASEALLTFDANGACTDSTGKVICRLSVRDNNWTAQNDLGINVTPVSFNRMEGIFDVEAEFCLKWLEQVCI